jgi:predicted O-methyltransferase YrrM
MNNRFEYSVFLEKFKDASVKYEMVESSIKLVERDFPWSLLEDEFNYLKNIIIKNDLVSGYEVATGFGISSLAAGLGFKETGGRLLTIDAYVEEHLNQPNAGKEFDYFKNEEEDAIGYASIKQLIKEYSLQSHISPEIGWSPDDVDDLIEKNNFIIFDYVFIDSGNWDDRLINDFNAVYPYIDKDRFFVAFHDSQTLSDEVVETITDKMGVQHQIISVEKHYNTMIFSNLKL